MKHLFIFIFSVLSVSLGMAQNTNLDELTEGREDIILKIKKHRIGGKYSARVNINKEDRKSTRLNSSH